MYYLITYWNEKSNSPSTIEVEQEEITQKDLDRITPDMLFSIYDLYLEAVRILEDGNIEERYHTKYIPKKSGGFRRIDIPDEHLKAYMRKVVRVFTKKTKLIFPKQAYAYIKGRNTKQMAEAHLGNCMVFKTDIKDFFHNCTLDFVLSAMNIVYPFCLMDITILEEIIKACMIQINENYVLPQGAPSSPILSNIAMIPVDYRIQEILSNCTYTRYADDIFISCPIFKKQQNAVWVEMSRTPGIIETVFQRSNSRLYLNDKKTRILDISKTNGIWITGLMLNSNQNVTIGYRSKKKLKATIFNLLMDAKNGEKRSKAEVDRLHGIVGYWRFIEPVYVDRIIQKLEQKTGVNYSEALANICSD